MAAVNQKRQLHEIVQNISDDNDSDIFLFSHSITAETADELIIKILDFSSDRPNVLLIATTYGGDPDAAFRIARFLKRKYKKFTLYVFGYCKSAGTLLALGADEIVMSDFGELGPLDIQVSKDDDFRYGSGLDINQALRVLRTQAFSMFEDYFLSIIDISQAAITPKTAADIASSMSVDLLSPIAGQIEPLKLGEMDRMMQIAWQYGLRLNSKMRETIARLVSDYPSHSFVIDYSEAKELFGCVREPTEPEHDLERFIFEYVRKPFGIITNLLMTEETNNKEVRGGEDAENESGYGGTNKGLAEGANSPNNGKSETTEPESLHHSNKSD